MKKLLLHVCCGPCSIYPIDKLKTEFSISVFYYNPNIHPEIEYNKRKQAAQQYCIDNNIQFICPEYNAQEYFRAIKGQEKNKNKRCPLCYKLRLEQTAIYAQAHQFDYFTSTLLISPYQDIDLVKQLGEALALKHNLKFYSAQNENSNKKYKGFRPGFASGRKKSKALHMYEQKYCGCIFSRNEL